MLPSTSYGIDIASVTLANDDGRSRNAHIFQYNMNTETTRKNLYEGALRGHYERERKKTCINLPFSDGAFNEVVLKALVELGNGPKTFIVGKEEVERVAIDSRQELSGKYVNTKIEFRANGDKIMVMLIIQSKS